LQSMLFLVDFQSGSQRIGVTGFCLGGALTLYALATVPGLLKFVLSLLYCECVIDISFFLSSSVSISKSLKMKVRTLIK
jgi:poly(3-hydroxyalkanoate) synthetase